MKAGSILGYTAAEADEEPLDLLDDKINDRIEFVNSILRLFIKTAPAPILSSRPMSEAFFDAIMK